MLDSFALSHRGGACCLRGVAVLVGVYQPYMQPQAGTFRMHNDSMTISYIGIGMTPFGLLW